MFAYLQTGFNERTARMDTRRCLRCGCGAMYDCELKIKETTHHREFKELELHGFLKVTRPVGLEPLND